MVAFIMHFSKRFFILSILIFIPIVRTNSGLFDGDLEDYLDEDNPGVNESLAIIASTTTTKLTSRHSSTPTFLKALSTPHISSTKMNKNTTSTGVFTNQSTSFPQPTTTKHRKPSTTIPSRTLYTIVSDLVSDLNRYRNTDILSHIKQCDTHLKLEEMCEIYSFDNHTYSLIRERDGTFQSLQNIYDVLVDPLIVQKLSKFCPTGQWCLGNLTDDEVYYTATILKQRGRSFCFLEKCHHRLMMHSNVCASIIPKNISIPTLKLMPMLCDLHREQQSWNTTKCADQIVYLLHYLYAFWPQLETCHHVITAGSGGCTMECFAFESLLRQTENQCHRDASFLTRVPVVAWYRSINLRQVCNPKTMPAHTPFISSVKDFISSNVVWYQLHQRPVYAVLFVLLIICIVSSFSLCLYMMSKNDYESNTRHLDDDYEYTRLHDSTFELGANTEIPNTDGASSRMINESETDFIRNNRSAEHQRLLYTGM